MGQGVMGQRVMGNGVVGAGHRDTGARSSAPAMLVMQDGSTIELTPEASRRDVVALSDDPLLLPDEAHIARRRRSSERESQHGDLLEHLVVGMTTDDIVAAFTELTVDHVRAALEFAALRSVGSSPLR